MVLLKKFSLETFQMLFDRTGRGAYSLDESTCEHGAPTRPSVRLSVRESDRLMDFFLKNDLRGILGIVQSFIEDSLNMCQIVDLACIIE